MKTFGTSSLSKAGTALVSMWAGVLSIAASAAPQAAPAPPPPSAIPVQPLSNPNMDQVYLNVRNGNLSTQAALSAPYARAMAFVRCAGGSIKAQPIMNTDFGSREESKLVDRVVRGSLRCGESAAGVPVFLMRAAITEGAVRSQKSIAAAADVSMEAGSGIDPQIAPMLASALKMTQCQVKTNLGAAHAVLLTPAGSPDEKAAEDRLVASTPQCGGKEQTAGLDSVAYRAAIASVVGRATAGQRTEKN